MRQPFSGTAERIFMKRLPNDSWENRFSIAIPMGARPPMIFFWGGGLKTTQCALGADAWRMNENWFMMVWYCTAVALKGHERVNAFNLVVMFFSVFLNGFELLCSWNSPG